MQTKLKTKLMVLLWLLALNAVVRLHAQPEMKLPTATPVLPSLLVKRLVSAGSFTAYIEIATGKTHSNAKAEAQRGRLVVHDGAVRFALNTTGSGVLGGKSLDGPYMLMLPAKRVRYAVLEAIDGYVETPLEDLEAMAVDCTELAHVREGGNDTVKFRCRVSSGTNPPQESLLWILSKSGGLPVRMESNVGGTNTVITLKNFKPGFKSGQSEFVLPSGLKQYPSEEALMAEMFSRMAAFRPKPPYGNMPPGGSSGGRPPGGGGPPQ